MFRRERRSNEKFFEFVPEGFFLFLRSARNRGAHRKRDRDDE
jgi:hypothetical protein